MYFKPSIAFTIITHLAVFATVSAVNLSSATLRSSTEKVYKKTKLSKNNSTKHDTTGSVVPNIDLETNLTTALAPKRIVKESVVTMKGVSHDRPLTGEEAIFLEQAIKDALEGSRKDDDVTTRAVVLVKEELDEDYYPHSPHGGDRSLLRGGSSGHHFGRDLFSETVDDGDFFDITILTDFICYLCDDGEGSDPRIIRTTAPTPPPVKNATCSLCNPDDNNRPSRAPIPSPARVPTSAPTRVPASAPVRVPTPAPVIRVNSDAGTILCSTLRQSNFPRFKTATSCIIK